ncbi:glycoside hydrolase family 5 protein [Agromyces sp. MMS24-K17]|uniref:glycoside hydrolase family 5 protein n=1 Tax=Agromyces sp. MMS24-K17 TaxID=3372850 RepID=UPI003754E1FC
MNPIRRPIVAVSTTLVLVVVQAILDPTGLLALVGWTGAVPRFDVGPWPFAAYAVFLPVLLAVVWWVAARAGDRYWTLVPGIVLAVLLAQAAACVVMTWDLAVAGRAAGYVTAKAVPAALLVAATTRWFGGPTTRTRLESGSTWPAAAVLALAAPLLTGLWWTGAAYAPGVPVARFDHGVVPVLVAVAMIAGLAALSLRWMRARVPGVLGGWLAAVVAGGMAGLVQALVAGVVDGGFAGDIWPVMAAYVAVADGLAFGACVGWLAGITAVVVDRFGAGRAARVAKPAVVAAAVVAVALAVVVARPVDAVAVVDPAASGVDGEASAPPGFLRAEGDRIVDGRGNQVLLRGVNVNQLVDFYRPRDDVDATRPLTEDDFEGIAAQGFDVVRLNLSWSALEPERGTLDGDYLARIEDAVAWAGRHDLYVVLDLHQDSWWNGPTPEGTACRPGTDPMWGYDGAPEWATITDGAPRCQFNGRDISPAGNRAFQHFYFDTDGVQTALVETWGRLAEVFRDEQAVAGFDLMNEPGFGETAPVTTSHLLGRFYDRAIDEIRAAGAPQIVFVEPSILWSGLGFDSGPAVGFTDDPNIVFSPHLYAESLTMDRALGIPPIVGMERQFTLAQRVAAEYGAPLWSGEIGYWGDEADVEARLARYAVAEDAHVLGSAYWVWKQACGDPQNGIGDFGNGLMMQDCATGGDAPPKDDLLAILGRAYPRSAPGTVTELAADGATVSFTGLAGEGCGLEVWIPGAAEPAVEATGVGDLDVARVSGGWIATGCVDGDYAFATREADSPRP